MVGALKGLGHLYKDKELRCRRNYRPARGSMMKTAVSQTAQERTKGGCNGLLSLSRLLMA